ncbi:MAG: Stp1/IreP family PP2C-type Ser/Thr phosphatase [Actinobacteria bacterium]|nr:MAG: Stp1/IreP family PP2C-type Ser/Thr phosphatase [Actinomycetota bacterium]
MSARKGALPYAGASDVGLVRSGNEDFYVVNPPLYAVADGLGGHQAGEVASQIAIETLLGNSPARADAKALGRAVRAANAAVIEGAQLGLGRSGMGTTLTAAMVEGTRIAVAHVGDSRAYLLHLGELTQLTADHSMVADMVRAGTLSEAESRVHPNRSVITRALGSDPNMLVDAFELEAAPGDRLLLCSDGLTSMVEDAAIEEILQTAPSPNAAVVRLIAAANDAGGQDNITTVVVDIEGSSPVTAPRPVPAQRVEHAVPRERTRRWPARVAWVLVASAIVAGAWYATYSYAQAQAYLIARDGVVAVYRGVPGSFAGVSLNWLESVTDIPVDELDPVTAARLRNGVRVDGLAPAFSLVATYRLQTEHSSESTTTP